MVAFSAAAVLKSLGELLVYWVRQSLFLRNSNRCTSGAAGYRLGLVGQIFDVVVFEQKARRNPVLKQKAERSPN